MTKALVVGGVASYVNETARKKLARWGLAVEWHVEMGKTRQEENPNLPAGCEVVVLFDDMVSNKRVTKAWRTFASSHGVRLLVLDRHESHWPVEMERCGFKTIPPVAAAAVRDEEVHEMAQQQKTTPTAPSEFHERLAFVKEALRELHEKDGVLSIQWDAKTGMLRWSRPVTTVEEGSL
jgi:hypothetical protein